MTLPRESTIRELQYLEREEQYLEMLQINFPNTKFQV